MTTGCLESCKFNTVHYNTVMPAILFRTQKGRINLQQGLIMKNSYYMYKSSTNIVQEISRANIMDLSFR